ncbi:MAG TPA: methionyl-tRNA formyltransferase [Thermoanaerobaculia bacterium]
MSLRVAFFGTPDFAVPSLARLVEEDFPIPLVVTQPDRPVGRHSDPVPSAVARAAAEHGLEIAKPERLRGNGEVLRRVQETLPDVGVVVAYGRILPPEILSAPRLGFVNVHASLLPKYRGASPIQAALLAGDDETGVVTMRVVDELDAGPLYLERSVRVEERESAASLSERLSRIGAALLVETLEGLERGSLTARPQEGVPTYCRQIRREDGEIDWTRPAGEIDRRLRAFTPWPGIFTFADGDRVKILDARPGSPTERPPGTLWREGDRIQVAAGDRTSLELLRLQRAGRRPVSAAEFAKSLSPDARLGPA